MRFALDCNISDKDANALRKAGHQVMVIAFESEPDEEWLERAFDTNVDIVVSDDNQVYWDAKTNHMVPWDIDELKLFLGSNREE